MQPYKDALLAIYEILDEWLDKMSDIKQDERVLPSR